ncbi:MAG: hypothetical protein J3K34DRAFT_419172 [Monoraphidium minutum]|nr:MAG: hypothetical protein J3K34DRAFT_419172 [Monoraphidium minutum]
MPRNTRRGPAHRLAMGGPSCVVRAACARLPACPLIAASACLLYFVRAAGSRAAPNPPRPPRRPYPSSTPPAPCRQIRLAPCNPLSAAALRLGHPAPCCFASCKGTRRGWNTHPRRASHTLPLRVPRTYHKNTKRVRCLCTAYSAGTPPRCPRLRHGGLSQGQQGLAPGTPAPLLTASRAPTHARDAARGPTHPQACARAHPQRRPYPVARPPRHPHGPAPRPFTLPCCAHALLACRGEPRPTPWNALRRRRPAGPTPNARRRRPPPRSAPVNRYGAPRPFKCPPLLGPRTAHSARRLPWSEPRPTPWDGGALPDRGRPPPNARRRRPPPRRAPVNRGRPAAGSLCGRRRGRGLPFLGPPAPARGDRVSLAAARGTGAAGQHCWQLPEDSPATTHAPLQY